MSISVKIRTDKHPEPKEVFEALVNKGERIIITSPEYPSVKFGNLNTALRGIEVNEEENGIEVRICSFGSADDYRLFGKTIDAVMKLTGGKAYYEDDDEDEVTNPLVRFDDQWVDSERESMLNMYRILCPVRAGTAAYCRPTPLPAGFPYGRDRVATPQTPAHRGL